MFFFCGRKKYCAQYVLVWLIPCSCDPPLHTTRLWTLISLTLNCFGWNAKMKVSVTLLYSKVQAQGTREGVMKNTWNSCQLQHQGRIHGQIQHSLRESFTLFHLMDLLITACACMSFISSPWGWTQIKCIHKERSAKFTASEQVKAIFTLELH